MLYIIKLDGIITYMKDLAKNKLVGINPYYWYHSILVSSCSIYLYGINIFHFKPLS